MFRELLSSPCWFFAAAALAFIAYSLGRLMYDIVQKRWSLTTIAKRLTKIERKLDGVHTATSPRPKSLPKLAPRLRLVHSVGSKKTARASKGNVVRVEFGKSRNKPPNKPPSGAA